MRALAASSTSWLAEDAAAAAVEVVVLPCSACMRAFHAQWDIDHVYVVGTLLLVLCGPFTGRANLRRGREMCAGVTPLVFARGDVPRARHFLPSSRQAPALGHMAICSRPAPLGGPLSRLKSLGACCRARR